MSISKASWSDIDFVSSCISWIEDDEKRAGATWLACAHFLDNEAFDKPHFKFMVDEKVHMNKIHNLRLQDFGKSSSPKP